MNKIDFINMMTQMYDDSMETIKTEDEDKITGRLINLAQKAKEEDPTFFLELGVFSKCLQEYCKEEE